MITVQTKLPDQLYKKAVDLVNDGWFRDANDIMTEALRRFLDSHQAELMEKYILEDVEWGLHGDD